MATKKMDLPPRGDFNLDPITNEPGSHPIETGIGAAVAGAASGIAAGAMGGPVAAAVGVAVGAVAGGYAGKGVGEMIDPTEHDDWLRNNFDYRPYVKKGDTFDTFKPAYRFGGRAEAKYGDSGLDLTDKELQKEWEAENKMPWTKACDAVKDGYDRSIQLRKEQCAEEVQGD
jgi:hypothetical protein